ncbi:unnamed protein product [Cuscuta epithymum]|uniref:Uncharacterized protein n=1 Tax=Cuscuta epithymum TaxID=186058 RepID=A0AAV0BY85_9ASTE|nr:unnamed protein product [Cuscuta epithymum]
MGKKSGLISFLELLKLKKKKKTAQRAEEDQYGREEVFVKKAYRVWPSDEDRLNWVADPQIDAKATAFLFAKRQQQLRKSSGTNDNDKDDNNEDASK